MQQRAVTEQDFRKPEFRDAKVEDYEFRADGAVVRKDRWESGIQSIRFLVGIDGREFEISDVVDAVHRLAQGEEAWVLIADCEDADMPSTGHKVDIRLQDGSVLCRAECNRLAPHWTWGGKSFGEEVLAWREAQQREDVPR